MVLKHGDTGFEVRRLQQALDNAGFRTTVDGWFGDGTEKALQRYQKKHDLVVDGIAGPQTWNHLMGRPDPLALRESDIVQAAKQLDVPVAAVHAVTEVESRGDGFDADGLPVILFERHIMYRRLRARKIDPAPFVNLDAGTVNRKPGGYVGGPAEHRRLRRAKAINKEAAIESASWGLFQIMGFHWETLGYASPFDFEDAMKQHEREQLQAFVRFILADKDLHLALANLDWAEFARRYNGPAYARNSYDSRLSAAFDRHQSDNKAAA